MTRKLGGTSEPAGSEVAEIQISRRTAIRAGLGAVGLALVAREQASAHSNADRRFFPQTPPMFRQPHTLVAVYPLPGTRTASPGTEITFRGVSSDEIGDVTVTGSGSGAHSGILIPHEDGGGASFVLDAPLRAEELVTVSAGLALNGSNDNTYTFEVVRPVSPSKISTDRSGEHGGGEPRSYRSRPDLKPPPIQITNASPAVSERLIFAGPRSIDGQQGPLILDNDGEPVWFHPLDGKVTQALDFRTQSYLGQPVLTWWEGTPAVGHGFGHFVIRDSSYQTVVELRAGNGFPGADPHEFLLTTQGTAFICIYHRVRWDTSAVGGEAEDLVMDSVIQELEIPSGRVLFEWHSLDHVGLDESFVPLPEEEHDTYDYFHINSVEQDTDGNIIVSARNTSAIYKIDRLTGEVLWRLGGTLNSFEMSEDALPRFQHDARVHDGGQLSLFDNAVTSQDDVPSRGLVLELDTDAMTATIVKEFIHPDKIASSSQGNLQVLQGGNAFIGWGSNPVFSEFSADGTMLFDGRFPNFVTSYRAYRLPWVGQPVDNPALAAEKGAGDDVTVFASWNGATEVATWRVLAGDDPDQLQEIDTAKRDGFETSTKVQTTARYVAVQAVDSAGNLLGVSQAIEPTPS